MKSLTEQEVAPFLDELSALSRKHGIWIQACGCCESPYLVTGERDAWELFMDEPKIPHHYRATRPAGAMVVPVSEEMGGQGESR